MKTSVFCANNLTVPPTSNDKNLISPIGLFLMIQNISLQS